MVKKFVLVIYSVFSLASLLSAQQEVGQPAPCFSFHLKTEFTGKELQQLKNPEKRIEALCNHNNVKKNEDALFDNLTETEKKEFKESIAFYVTKAAQAYRSWPETQSYFIFSEEQWVTVCLDYQVEFYKGKDLQSNNLKIPVPARFGSTDGKNYVLQISPSFFTRFDHETRISKIAHEVIGHGIPFRYFSEAIDMEPPSKTQKKPSLRPDEKNGKRACYKEGLATCIEAIVYNMVTRNKKRVIEFAETTYRKNPSTSYTNPKDDPAYSYIEGVKQHIATGIAVSCYGDIWWELLNSKTKQLGGKGITPVLRAKPQKMKQFKAPNLMK